MRIDIVDTISRFVKLTKLGPGYAGICPFCGADGKTDFRVSVQHQKYSCDKCGASGGIFQFLLNLRNIPLEEALKEVREAFNIPLDAHFLDSRWNEPLQGTDFQQVLGEDAKKAAVFESSDSGKEKGATERGPISYTELATFIRCSLEYKLRYRDKAKIYEPVGTRVYLGRFLHSVATQFLKVPMGSRNNQFIEVKFQQEITTDRNSEYIDELRRYEVPTTVLMLENFVDKTISIKNPHFKTKFGPFTIVGTADCLVESSKGTEIIEFKEYDYREFDEDMEIMHYLQLLFYFFGLGGREAGISGGAYCFFSSGYTDEVIFSDEMIGQGKEFIEAKLQQMTACQEFTPKLNALCVSCGYRDKCKLQVETKGRI